ncbi:hypothetical protein HK096_001922 [Nowakowskiella sp. JEL0078]|nr:hypothetical protein HK096_001922 [Nowakowskiella sp. JEL0078]
MAKLFVTVGTTKFDALIDVLVSYPFLTCATTCGFETLEIQIGNSVFIPPASDNGISVAIEDDSSIESGQCVMNIDFPDGFVKKTLRVVVFRFKQNLSENIDSAGFVISHAGSGSILEALYLKKKLLIVINNSLMDNHQAELALQLEKDNFLWSCTPSTLVNEFEDIMKTKSRHDLQEFIQGDSETLTDNIFVVLSSQMFDSRNNCGFNYIFCQER